MAFSDNTSSDTSFALRTPAEARQRRPTHSLISAVSERPFSAFVIAALCVIAVVDFLFPSGVGPLLLLLIVAALWLLAAESQAQQQTSAIIRDADEMDEARRKAEDASQAKSRFLAMVSHEVRTPLNGILGMTHLLERTALSAEQESYVAAVRRSGTVLYDLVADLLDFSTIEAGRFDLRPTRTDLAQTIEDVIELMAPKAHEKGLDIAAFCAPGTPHTITTDANRLRQVLFNLIGNAVKFTDRGAVTLDVARGQTGLVITVADSGPGLAPGDRERIFGEFEQAGERGMRGASGVGLGLAISARIVAAMGGHIAVDSVVGQGSRFIVSLPLHALDDGEAPTQDSLADTRTLLIMPDTIAADMLCRTIEAERGHVYQRADADGDIAAFCRSHAITDIIVDQRLAASTADALAAIPTFDGGGPKRILMVRPSEREALDNLHMNGFDGWLIAPVRRASLNAVLRGDFTQAAQAGAVHPDDDRLRSEGTISRPLTILVAEDNPVNALLITTVLQREGHAVTLVDDGLALVSATFDTQTGEPLCDLVITDLTMPILDGVSAIEQIRRHEKRFDLRPVPILVLSADGQDEARLRAIDAGADFFIEKPVAPQTLLHLIAGLPL